MTNSATRLLQAGKYLNILEGHQSQIGTSLYIELIGIPLLQI